MTRKTIITVFVALFCIITFILQVQLYSQNTNLADTTVFNTPRNFQLEHWYTGPNYFRISWEIPDTTNCFTTLSGYNIYRNFQMIDWIPCDSLSYLEVGPPLMENYLTYYYITATYINPVGESASTDTLSHGHAIGIDNDFNKVPVTYIIKQNYPNPFNPTTMIEYSIPKKSFVKITIYDVIGNKVETLISKILEPGYYTYLWNASKYSSGIYFLQFISSDFTDKKKMLFVK